MVRKKHFVIICVSPRVSHQYDHDCQGTQNDGNPFQEKKTTRFPSPFSSFPIPEEDNFKQPKNSCPGSLWVEVKLASEQREGEEGRDRRTEAYPNPRSTPK
jgi:hypothetical protein